VDDATQEWLALLAQVEASLVAATGLLAPLAELDDDTGPAGPDPIDPDGRAAPPRLPVELRARAAAVLARSEELTARLEARRDELGRALASIRRVDGGGQSGPARYVDRTC
jgi:hypothetical protein